MKKGSIPTLLSIIILFAVIATTITLIIVGGSRIIQGPQTCEALQLREEVCYSSVNRNVDITITNRGGANVEYVRYVTSEESVRLPQSSLSGRGSSFQIRVPVNSRPGTVELYPYVQDQQCEPIILTNLPLC